MSNQEVRQDIEHDKRKRGFSWEKDETFLRRVEIDVLIPKKMRDKGRIECKEEVKAFTECCSTASLAMIFKCRQQNKKLKACLERYYTDPDFFEMCKKEYLQERKEFRETGIRPKDKISKANETATAT